MTGGAERDLWRFHGVSVAATAISVFDGLSESEWQPVAIRAGATVEAVATFRPPSGVVLRLCDSERQPLLGAHVHFTAEATVGRPALTIANSVVGRAGEGRGGKVLQYLAPGRYSYGVFKWGYEPATGEIDIRRGEVSEVEAVLR